MFPLNYILFLQIIIFLFITPGTPRIVMISYSMKSPDQSGNGEKLARLYFNKAIESSGGHDCSPYVTLAELVSVNNQDHKEFEELLKKALTIDIDIDPELKLSNIISQSRARWLLEQKEELFY